MASSSRRNGKDHAFPANAAPPSFFKVVPARALLKGKLKIPEIDLLKLGDCIKDRVLLKVPDGSVWPVKMTRCGRWIMLQKGWPEFAHYYSLEDGSPLLFSYEGEFSHFRVRIFRKNGPEMDYFTSSDQDEMDSDPIGESKCQRMKNVEMDYFTSSDEDEMDSDPIRESKCQRMKNVMKKRKHVGDGGMSATHKSSEVHKRTSNGGLEVLKKRAFATARYFESKNPFTVIKMQPSYLKNHLKICAPFAQKHIIAAGECEVALQISDTKTWLVRCFVNEYGGGQPCARFHDRGWKAFARDNQLEEGDACVFELTDNAPIVTFNVFVFRAKDQED